jgi:thiol:disulfide interchange protein DsbD
VGGMILNLMPCVFPVLGLKVMGFVKQAGSDPRKIRLHGIAFAGGLVVSMWVLAGIILMVKLALGQDVNWGAQMGNPYFVCAMIVLLFVLGLNMSGVFEFGTSMTRVGGTLQGKQGYSSSFLSGVLTTLIATPCSGPFLGAAMSYTLAQTAITAMFLFTIFALGIATPYLLLCFFPALINRLPRPGAWMETFKVTMAFALFATVAFFMQAFGGQTGAAGLSWLAMALVVIGLAAYYYGTWSAPHVSKLKRLLFGYTMPALIAGLGIWMCYSAASQRNESAGAYSAGGLAWQDWNPGKVEYSLAKHDRPIWVDYTAHW